MRLFRVIHKSALSDQLRGHHAPGRFHGTAEQARDTSYTSPFPNTCIKEVADHLGGMRLRDQILVEVAVAVEPSLVVDLRQSVDASLEELTGDDLSVPQGIAHQLRKKGIQALIVPSARDPKGYNVVLFLENIERGCIEKIREEILE